MIAVLCGGDGREREVSLRSGRAVCDALNETVEFTAELLDIKNLSEVVKLKDYDGAFIAMHGDWGEGGMLQAKLTEMKIPYTGSGPEASALAMNKWKSQEIFRREKIRTPESVLWPQTFAEVKEKFGLNVVVKPCSGGSTVGISVIHNLTELALTKAAYLARDSYNGDIIIEEFIAGRELTCAVWEHDGKTQALPIIEIKPHEGFYDYANKYTAGATEYIVPANLTPEESAKISSMAVKAHEVLGCSGYSRSDFRLSPEGEAYILEVNTAPGMTATSLVPKAANAAGISLPEFVKSVMLMAHR